MSDRNEIVTVDLAGDNKITLYGHITSRMEELGFNPCDYSELELGIPLPVDWPADQDDSPTLAELVIVARKLKMKIIIGKITMVPMKQ